MRRAEVTRTARCVVAEGIWRTLLDALPRPASDTRLNCCQLTFLARYRRGSQRWRRRAQSALDGLSGASAWSSAPFDHCAAKVMATPFMQYRRPVGGGPSSNT